MPEVENTIHIFFEIAQDNNSEMQQGIVAVDTARHDIMRIQKDSTSPKPTLEQIKHWRWLHEKKLKVDGSRYIQSKNNLKLTSTVKPENNSLRLPMREKNTVNTNWITILVFLALILFATIRNSYSSYIGNLFQSLINYSTANRLFREKNYPISHGAFRLDIIFYFTFSIFLYQIISAFHLEMTNENLTFYAVGLGLVIGYFMVKKIVYSLLGLMFESVAETSEYLFNLDIVNRTLGIVLFPVIVLINYYAVENPVFMVVTGIFVILVFYVFLIQRGVYILLRKQFSIFYTFLYLCTLEFLPLFLIYKVVVL